MTDELRPTQPEVKPADNSTFLQLARQHLQKAIKTDKPAATHFYAVAQAEFLAASYQLSLSACQKCLRLAPDNYEALILLAEIWLRLKRPQESFQAAKQALKLSKQREEGWTLAARAAIEAGKSDEAIKLLELYLKISKDRLVGPLVYILLAGVFLNTNEPEQALEQVEQAQARLKALNMGAGAGFVVLRARILRRLNRQVEALEYYQQALRLNPQNARVQAELGELLLEQEKSEEALRVFRQAQQLEPHNAQHFYKAGIAALQSSEAARQPVKRREAFQQQAIELLQTATKLDKSVHDYWYELAQAYTLTGNYAMVKQTMAHVLAQTVDSVTNPVKHTYYLRLYAWVCQKLGAFEEAVKTYQQILIIVPDDHLTLKELGELSYKLGKYGEAFNYFRRAEMLANDHPHYLASMSRVLLKLGRLEEAHQLVTEAAGYQPADYLVRHQLGAVLLEMNQSDAALEHLRAAAASEPDNAEFRYYLGRAYLNLGQLDEAIHEYQAALTAAPARHEWQAELSEIYLQEHAYLPALESLRVAVQLQPAQPDYHYNLAIVLAANGDLVGAIQSLQEAMEKLEETTNASWHYLLGRLLLELGRLDKALESFAQAHALEPHNPHYKVDLAKTLRLKGEPIEQVKNLLEEAIAADPDELQSFQELAYVYEASNNPEAALRTLEARVQEVLETVRSA